MLLIHCIDVLVLLTVSGFVLGIQDQNTALTPVINFIRRRVTKYLRKKYVIQASFHIQLGLVENLRYEEIVGIARSLSLTNKRKER